jgi:hypothetical protein
MSRTHYSTLLYSFDTLLISRLLITYLHNSIFDSYHTTLIIQSRTLSPF